MRGAPARLTTAVMPRMSKVAVGAGCVAALFSGRQQRSLPRATCSGAPRRQPRKVVRDAGDVVLVKPAEKPQVAGGEARSLLVYRVVDLAAQVFEVLPGELWHSRGVISVSGMPMAAGAEPLVDVRAVWHLRAVTYARVRPGRAGKGARVGRHIRDRLALGR